MVDFRILHRSILIVSASVVTVGLGGGVVFADLPSTNVRSLADNDKDKDTRSDDAAGVEQETERVVLQLVQSHLPELTGVLKQLRAVQPRAYESAIKDLARSARRLELAQNRDQRLFEIEVELLQAEHQTSLLMAKLKVRDSKADREKLRTAAKRLQQAQLARAEYDVELMRQRLQRSQQQFDLAVNRLESRKLDVEEQLNKSYLSMLRKAGRDGKRSESDSAPAPKRAPGATTPNKRSPKNSDPN